MGAGRGGGRVTRANSGNYLSYSQPNAAQSTTPFNSSDMYESVAQQPPPPPPETYQQPIQEVMKTESKLDSEMEGEEAQNVPSWMKSKLQGVKKISNKERRRRQNENLRRLLSPKNALMVLNEMMPGEQLANQFRVESAAAPGFYQSQTNAFCADLTIDGNNYKGYGDNKLSARNAAAEQAIRDLIIKRLAKAGESNGAIEMGEGEGESSGTGESLPMIQLASFALHKLFSEWEGEGHRVPHLKPKESGLLDTTGDIDMGTSSTGVPAVKKRKSALKERIVPANAHRMHPCMLLTYMRPALHYRELPARGDKPQNIVFSMSVNVDGQEFVGEASNKKEARRQAAQVACSQLFGVIFEDGAKETAPLAE